MVRSITARRTFRRQNRAITARAFVDEAIGLNFNSRLRIGLEKVRGIAFGRGHLAGLHDKIASSTKPERFYAGARMHFPHFFQTDTLKTSNCARWECADYGLN